MAGRLLSSLPVFRIIVQEIASAVQRRNFSADRARDAFEEFNANLDALLAEVDAPFSFQDSNAAKAIAEVRDRLRRQDRADSALERLEESASEAEEVLGATIRAAGKTGEATLATFYRRFGQREGWVAAGWRAATVLSVGGAGVSTFIAGGDSRLDTLELIHRSAIAIAALALAGIFGTEAARHGRAAQWAKIIGIQLDTLDAFSAPFDPEARVRVRELFAARVFGEISSAVSDFRSVPVSAELISKVAELAPKTK